MQLNFKKKCNNNQVPSFKKTLNILSAPPSLRDLRFSQNKVEPQIFGSKVPFVQNCEFLHNQLFRGILKIFRSSNCWALNHGNRITQQSGVVILKNLCNKYELLLLEHFILFNYCHCLASFSFTETKLYPPSPVASRAGNKPSRRSKFHNHREFANLDLLPVSLSIKRRPQ